MTISFVPSVLFPKACTISLGRPSAPNFKMCSTPPSTQAILEAISYAATHGIVVGQTKTKPIGTHLSHAPMTLYPSPLDAPSYQHALSITKPLNSLCARIAAQPEYLRSTLAETASADSAFTGRLMELLPNKPFGDVEMSIIRFDYFVHEEAGKRALRMVEMNCIAASFACLGTRTGEMHRYLASHPAVMGGVKEGELPPNDAMSGLAKGLIVAAGEYEKVYKRRERLAMIMVVQPGERNAYDQDLLRVSVKDTSDFEMVRLSLAEIAKNGRVEDGRLMVHLEGRGEDVEVAVVYFRAGYTPDDYPSETEWEAREMVERSVAVKCPSVAVQLVGTKKVQQVLDLEGEVEKFVGGEEAAQIRKTFARQYSLEKGGKTDRVVEMAIDRPDDFVLKPQREGGGNNMYSNDLKKALQSMSNHERSAYVLMERIRPVVVQNVLIREGEFSVVDIVSEFGVYGVFVSNKGQELANFVAGTLLRSKAASQDDGGVAAGVAVLDSPLLVE